ncbi:MAG: glycosyl hydrolase 115 family protein [Chitinophagaceae bacterium]|jgi:hypothetical protein|nr:glycosyl hydrolase 115 family protein [Chitinophagaceae bacterium]
MLLDISKIQLRILFPTLFFIVFILRDGYSQNLSSNKFLLKQLNTANSSDAKNYSTDTFTIKRGSWIVQNENFSQEKVVLIDKKYTCKIAVNENAGSAILHAAKCLSDDIKNISDNAPVIVRRANSFEPEIHLVTVGIDSIPHFIDVEKLNGKWESYQIITHDKDVWLVGSDVRGTVFACYELSERIGIDPLYLWTGYKPQHYNPLIIKPIDYYQPPPVFKYRGFFHDDEDILPKPYDELGYPYRFGNVPLEWYKRFFETALRLKMNMVAPYTRVRRRYEVQKCASDWGLFYTSHHYDILLSNPFGIERFHLAEQRGVSKDWDWLSHPNDMLTYWKGGVEENKNLSVIWPIGLRGTDDRAYQFPPNLSSSEQANVYDEVLNKQIEMVKNILPHNQNPVFTFTLYTEMLDKYEHDQKDFHVPKDAIIVWPDDNDGTMRNLPTGKGIWQHGVYYHLAYYGSDKTKQIVGTVSPDRIATQFKQIIASGATEYLLVNVSEMREFIMGARMISEICWQGFSTNQKTGNYVNFDGQYFTKWWSNEYFSPVADKVIQFYSDYYKMLYNPSVSCYGADVTEFLLDKLYKKINELPYDSVNRDSIRILYNREKKYKAIFNSVKNIVEKINPSQQQFFFENAELPLLIDYRQTQAACLLQKALQEQNLDKSMDFVRKAQHPLEKLEVELLRAERPPFENWYRPTWIRPVESKYNVHRSYDELRRFIGSQGKTYPIISTLRTGHKIEEHRIWSDFLNKLDSIKEEKSIE